MKSEEQEEIMNERMEKLLEAIERLAEIQKQIFALFLRSKFSANANILVASHTEMLRAVDHIKDRVRQYGEDVEPGFEFPFEIETMEEVVAEFVRALREASEPPMEVVLEHQKSLL